MSDVVVVLGPRWAVRRWKLDHPDDPRQVVTYGYPLMGRRLTNEDLVVLDGWNNSGWAEEWVRDSLILKFGPGDIDEARRRLEL